MNANDITLSHLGTLNLSRLGDDRPAGLLITSLPVPRGADQNFSLAGHATHVKPLGCWSDASSNDPRRLLLIADAEGDAPATIGVTRAQPTSTPAQVLPSAEMDMFAHSHETVSMYWERHTLKIEWQGRWIGLAMGMRVRGEVHWWEHANMVILSESNSCREVEMGGTIPYELTSAEMFEQFKGKDNPYHHHHNWLNGHIYARLHANGVCEIYARHINSRFFDEGRDLQDAVPVVGIRTAASEDELSTACGVWDGTQQDLSIGGVRFDLTDAAHLATPQQPGALAQADGFLVWQPYQGVEVYGGDYAEKRTGDPYMWHAEQQIIPKGMARTLRLSLSLNDDRAPRIARYVAPAWWYGVCEEFLPEPLLPVSNEYDLTINSARSWFRKYMVQGGFEDGTIPNKHNGDPQERQTAATEGDLPGALLMASFLDGDATDYDFALRACYSFTDILVDHATKTVRMQDYVPPAVALPLQRIHGCLAAWLETGDLFCLQTARAVIETAYWWHKNSWPRMGVGRDASFVHGAMLLYRYLGDRHFLELARDTISDVGASQWPVGSFGDQGGGAGIHGDAAYIAKPWMGWLATMGVLDYLEHFPDDEAALVIVRKFVDWLMSERALRTRNDVTTMGWTYQHQFKGKERPGVTITEGPTTGAHLFHFDYMARLLSYFSFRDGDPEYFDAFAQSYIGYGPERIAGYWECTATLYFLPWLQAKLWNARLTENGVEVQPSYFGPRTPQSAKILAPNGELELSWSDDEKVIAPEGVLVKPQEPTEHQLTIE